jgi:hypothetical protein
MKVGCFLGSVCTTFFWREARTKEEYRHRSRHYDHWSSPSIHCLQSSSYGLCPCRRRHRHGLHQQHRSRLPVRISPQDTSRTLRVHAAVDSEFRNLPSILDRLRFLVTQFKLRMENSLHLAVCFLDPDAICHLIRSRNSAMAGQS